MTERPPRHREPAGQPALAARDVMRKKVQTHRARLKAKGLRPVQLWLPDTAAASFRADARKQARAVSESVGEAEDIAFVEAVSDT